MLAPIMGRLVYLAIAIVAGLDKRFAWSPPLSLPLQITALILFVLALAWTDWAVVANRYVRHPGYLGSLRGLYTFESA